jgi:hypothetical protein
MCLQEKSYNYVGEMRERKGEKEREKEREIKKDEEIRVEE